jgi:hypothetical protein
MHSRPPTARSRSSKPRSPCPLPRAAPPVPSSVTQTRKVPPAWRSPTAHLLAWLCLATLVRASAITKYAGVSMAASSRRPIGSASSSTGTTERAARAVSASRKPRSARTGGAMPRDRARSSSSASWVCAIASASISLTASGLVSKWCWARPSSIASRTRRCCGPSWMSRSSRRSAVASAVTAATVCARAVSRSCSSPLIWRSRTDASHSSTCPSPAWAATHTQVTSGRVNSASRPSVIAKATCKPGDPSCRLTAVWEPRYRAMGGCGPGTGWLRRGNVMVATAANHHSAVATEVIRTTGSTTTACATSSHRPESDAAISCCRGRWLVASAPRARGRTLAIRHRSRSANQRAGARPPVTRRDPPGSSKPAAPTHKPPSTASRPAAANTGAVSR